MSANIKSILQESIAIKQAMLADEGLLQAIEAIVNQLVTTFQNGGKVLFCGNGGSAADAQHLAAELSGRFYLERKALFAEALHVNTSFITAIGNDYGFDSVYERAVEAMGREGDVLVALSTSGNSENVLRAIAKAKSLHLKVVGMTGETGGKMNGLCDYLIKIPSSDTPRIQEGHLLVGHVVCGEVERWVFG